jgi:hypothetical protein
VSSRSLKSFPEGGHEIRNRKQGPLKNEKRTSGGRYDRLACIRTFSSCTRTRISHTHNMDRSIADFRRLQKFVLLDHDGSKNVLFSGSPDKVSVHSLVRGKSRPPVEELNTDQPIALSRLTIQFSSGTTTRSIRILLLSDKHWPQERCSLMDKAGNKLHFCILSCPVCLAS